MPNSELSKYVYAILDQGQVVIGRLAEDGEFPSHDHIPIVMVTSANGLEVGHPAAMVFPATPENYDALQILYEGIKVPPIPLEPKEIALEPLNRQVAVLIKCSNVSYDDARDKPNSRMLVITDDKPWGSVSGSYKHMVPYDVYGNEITSLDYAKGDTDVK